MTSPLSSLSRARRWSTLGLASLLALAAALAGCGASPAAVARAPSAPVADAPGASYEASSPPSAGAPASGPMPPASEARPPGDVARKQESAGDRPGLGTTWGESRSSRITTTTFFRANDSEPSALASLWYNDREGARAQAAAEGYRTWERVGVPVGKQAITVSLRDGSGRPLPGYSAGGKTFAIGEAGERYVITLTNHSPARFEVVVSVDGLDVLDGKPAGFGKRGYLLNPHQTLDIEGFRQSESAVATFRFGSVRGSYAARTGSDRNVGVIGVAVFHERGTSMWPWDPQEVERRRDADPFPNRFATPPPP